MERQADVLARAKGFARRPAPWTGEDEILIDLEPEARLSGILLDEKGRPIEDVFLNPDHEGRA